MAGAQTMSGVLYGVGVGPGDPELMTVKAWRLISTARVISYLAANGGESTARAIAAPFIDAKCTEIAIDMPMRVEREPAQAAYRAGAERIAKHLDSGEDVVMLCEGDPLFYGSFMYVLELLAPKYSVQVVPGVISAVASAAALGMPLAKLDDVVKILPATIDEETLTSELRDCQTAVIIKVGRHFGKVKSALASLRLESAATAVIRATHETQEIVSVAGNAADSLPYFSTIIVRAGAA
jgi:precorrin-2/cobalt-factor-2 C20-methyltransferase